MANLQIEPVQRMPFMRFAIEREFLSQTFALHAFASVGAGDSLDKAVALPVVFKHFEGEEQFSQQPTPCLRMSASACQSLMDELWNAGFRPTEGTGSAGAMAATERHLRDLQRLVFKDQPPTK